MTKIISKRYLDKFAPGDEIPAGVYSAEVIAKWVTANKVTVTDQPAAANKPARRKKAAAKK